MINLKAIYRWTEIDLASIYSIFMRIWSVMAGPITLAMIGFGLTPTEQGYYIAFLSVMGYTTFIQFGLGRVVIQFSSHEWSRLSIDQHGYVTGDSEAKANLSNLAKFAFKWFFCGGVASLLILGIVGYYFFMHSKQPDVPIVWQPQWISLCIFVSLYFLFFPLYFLLEGCHKTTFFYKFNFWRSILGNITIWTAIYFGAGLWTYTFYYLVSLPLIIYFIVYKNWRFFSSLFFNDKIGKGINWIKDILPMQWQITVISICSYFMFQLFTQSSMYARGPERAGQTGMTWSMILLLGPMASAFLAPKMPGFGKLIAKKESVEFHRKFFKAYGIGASIMVAGALGIICCVYLLNVLPMQYCIEFSKRILPPKTTAIFLLAYIIWTLIYQMGLYMIAHKKTPHWWICVSATICTSLVTYFLGGKYGLNVAGFGLIIVYLLHVPVMLLLYRYYRNKWHGNINRD